MLLQTQHKKMKFSIKAFFSKCNQIRSFLRIWSHLLKKSLMENFIFCAVKTPGDTLWTYLITCIPLATFSELFQSHISIHLSIHKECSMKERYNTSEVFSRGRKKYYFSGGEVVGLSTNVDHHVWPMEKNFKNIISIMCVFCEKDHLCC